MSPETEYVHRFFLELIKRRIAMRAYELYQARGDAGGSALDDWLQAEDEVLGQSISAPLYHRRKAMPHAVQ